MGLLLEEERARASARLRAREGDSTACRRSVTSFWMSRRMSRGLRLGVVWNLMSVRGVGAGLPAWESIWWGIWNSAKAGGQASYPTQMSGAASLERVVEKLLTSRKGSKPRIRPSVSGCLRCRGSSAGAVSENPKKKSSTCGRQVDPKIERSVDRYLKPITLMNLCSAFSLETGSQSPCP